MRWRALMRRRLVVRARRRGSRLRLRRRMANLSRLARRTR